VLGRLVCTECKASMRYWHSFHRRMEMEVSVYCSSFCTMALGDLNNLRRSPESAHMHSLPCPSCFKSSETHLSWPNCSRESAVRLHNPTLLQPYNCDTASLAVIAPDLPNAITRQNVGLLIQAFYNTRVRSCSTPCDLSLHLRRS
jgi:hypothetical protein